MTKRKEKRPKFHLNRIVDEKIERDVVRWDRCGCRSCRQQIQDSIRGWFQNRELNDTMWNIYLKTLDDD